MLFLRGGEGHDAEFPGVVDGDDLIVEAKFVVEEFPAMFLEDLAGVGDGIEEGLGGGVVFVLLGFDFFGGGEELQFGKGLEFVRAQHGGFQAEAGLRGGVEGAIGAQVEGDEAVAGHEDEAAFDADFGEDGGEDDAAIDAVGLGGFDAFIKEADDLGVGEFAFGGGGDVAVFNAVALEDLPDGVDLLDDFVRVTTLIAVKGIDEFGFEGFLEDAVDPRVVFIHIGGEHPGEIVGGLIFKIDEEGALVDAAENDVFRLVREFFPLMETLTVTTAGFC